MASLIARVGRTTRIAFLALSLLVLRAPADDAAAEPLALPTTPALPKAARSGHADVNGIRIWHAVFGSGPTVILLHGGLANADYWGHQVPELAERHRVVVMDSRGHGRSTRDERPFSYALMASDVVGLMDALKIDRAAIVGWSDGAIIGLELALHHPGRLTGLFAFAGNTDPSALKSIDGNPLFDAYKVRAKYEYLRLSSTPDQFEAFVTAITNMWETQPNVTAEQLRSIRVPTWIVAGDRDELIKRENTLFMADLIPGAALLIQAGVGHFAFLQSPQQFTDDVRHFLTQLPATRSSR